MSRKQKEADPAKVELGRHIKRAREAAGLTQGELGELVGSDGRSVGNWERGVHHPRSAVGRLEKVLGVSLETGNPTQDPVHRAVHASVLTADRQMTVLSTYERELRQQRSEEEAS